MSGTHGIGDARDYGLTPEELEQLADIQPEPAPRLIVGGIDALNEVPADLYEKTHGLNSPPAHNGTENYTAPDQARCSKHPMKIVPTRIAVQVAVLFGEVQRLRERGAAGSEISALVMKMRELLTTDVSVRERFFQGGGAIDVAALRALIADLER